MEVVIGPLSRPAGTYQSGFTTPPSLCLSPTDSELLVKGLSGETAEMSRDLKSAHTKRTFLPPSLAMDRALFVCFPQLCYGIP